LLSARRRFRIAELLLLAGDRLGRALARARIGVGALAAHRQAATMTQAAIAAEVHQTLDVDAGLTTQVTLDEIVAVDHFADLQDFLVGELTDAALLGNLHLLHDVTGDLRADAMDVLQRDQHALVGRNVYAGNTGHGLLSCCRSSREDRALSSCYLGQVSTNANTTPSPGFPGARHRLKLSDLDAGLIKGFQGVSSTAASV